MLHEQLIKTQKTHEEIFTSIYERCYWGNNQNSAYKGSSGQGSRVEFNQKTYIPFIRQFISDKKIQTVVDLGCGDFICGEALYNDLDIMYHGYDVYEKMIEFHTSKYSSPKYNFYHLDIFSRKEELIPGDLCILKDILQHWSTNEIYLFLDYLIDTKKYKYILISNCSHKPFYNIDTGAYRPLKSTELPLKKYGAVKQLTWDTKELSLITVE